MRCCSPGILLIAVLLCCCAVVLSGCSTEQPEFRFNQVEYLKQERQLLDEGEDFPEHYRQDIDNLVTSLFGTPAEPFFPFLEGEDDPAHDLISLDNLRMSAGAVSSDRDGQQIGLYREHCAQCHGVTGDGKGPTSGFMNPYPRDFRMGRFKFKSTSGRISPTDEDLKRILHQGITGTAMPSFKLLSDEEVDALVDYVQYLAIRGQVERLLIQEIAELDNERLLNLDGDEDADSLEEQLEFYIEDYVIPTIGQWVRANERGSAKVTEQPEGFPNSPELIAQGKQLFHGRANCAQCHGSTGLGDGQTENYDFWTTDWLETKGVDPNDPESYADFIEAGAFPPKTMRPRNLRLRVFRGGNRPEDIYYRIKHGISGTPMPAASAMDEKKNEIWALVAYVLSMPDEPLTAGN